MSRRPALAVGIAIVAFILGWLMFVGAPRWFSRPPKQVAAAAPHTSATAWRLSAKARPRLMKIAANSPASTAAAVLRSRPGEVRERRR